MESGGIFPFRQAIHGKGPYPHHSTRGDEVLGMGKTAALSRAGHRHVIHGCISRRDGDGGRFGLNYWGGAGDCNFLRDRAHLKNHVDSQIFGGWQVEVASNESPEPRHLHRYPVEAW